jgi:hypothetical protein
MDLLIIFIALVIGNLMGSIPYLFSKALERSHEIFRTGAEQRSGL